MEHEHLAYEIKDKSIELLKNSTIHGVQKVVRSRNVFRKLIWLSLIVMSYSYCTHSVFRSISDYLRYPVITNFDVIYEKQPDFPAVTFCNFNQSDLLCIFNFEVCNKSTLVFKYRNCLSFNLGTDDNLVPTRILKSKESGKAAGLNLHLIASTPTFEFPGVTVFINNQSSGISIKKGITVSAGMKTNIILSRSFRSKLSEPFSDCKTDISFPTGPNALSNKTKFMYSQSECFRLCFLEKTAENCNRLNEFKRDLQYYYTNEIYFWKVFNAMRSECSSLKIQDTQTLFTKLGENKICEAMCPVECNTMSYSITINSQIIDPLLNISRRVSIIEIYYNDFSYTSIIEIPKTSFEDLIGNVGGILGVFLGTSLISFVEIPELIYSLCYVVFRNRKKKKSLNVKKKQNKSNIITISSSM